jgi:hypothetical protein
METTQTHWKKLTNQDYIGAYSLNPKEERIVKIISVSKKLVKGADGKSEECTIAELDGEKPFILNRTNCKTITAIYKTPYVEEWAGKYIKIFATTVKAFGEQVECLRIRKEIPNQTLPELTPAHPKWNDVKQAMTNGYTIDQIKTKYTLSAQTEKLLTAK